MKKITLVLIGMLVLLGSGCTLTYKLDFESLDKKLGELKSSSINLETVVSTVEEHETFLGEMESIYVTDMEEKFHIKGQDYFEDGVIRTSIKDDLNIYMVLNPKEGKLEEGKTKLDEFFSSLNNNQEQVKSMIKTTVDGYIVYILTTKNEEVLTKIKNAKPLIFPSIVNIDKEAFSSKYSLNVDDIETVYYKAPMMSVTESMVMIVKATTGKSSSIKKQINKILTEKEQSINYPSQRELFKNRLETRLGNYLIYIVSIDNNTVLKSIEESKQTSE